MDPYRVWLSEVMLQQTTVAAVKPYFAAFVARWPTVSALAAAREEDVMAAWAGLGYYSRARNLVKAAQTVAGRGGFPETQQELRDLPGIGEYTSAAIAAIAFGARAIVVDANIERVVARLFAIAEPLPRGRKAIRTAMHLITPERRAGDFAQAMMDLGSGICLPRHPSCPLCPLQQHCAAHLKGDPAAYPVKPVKKQVPDIHGTAFWIERDEQVWLVTRPGSAMLGGMRALPDDGWTARGDGSHTAPLPAYWQEAGIVRHGFTHAKLTLRVRACQTFAQPDGTGEWWPVAALGDAGLPTLFAKAARLAMANRRQPQFVH